jgi:tetratricopeptide (TPR) repeat protein
MARCESPLARRTIVDTEASLMVERDAMASAEKRLAAAQPHTSAALRQLWEDGHRGAAIRAALHDWERLIRQGDDLHWLAEALRSSGLPVESLAAQLRSTRREGRIPAWEGLIASVINSGDPWWARELLAEVRGDSRALQALRIEAELALGDPIPLVAKWVEAHRDEAAREAAVRWWIRSERVEEAARLVDQSEGLTLWRARLALWRNRPEVARPLLATLPQDPEVRCLEAITCVLEGNLEQGEARLRDLLDTDVRAEAWTWLATVLRKQERYADVLRAADAASSASIGFNLVARLERELASDRARIGRGPLRWLRTFVAALRLPGGFRLRKVRELENAAALYPLGVKPRDSLAALELALERFAGNHTIHLSTTDEGRLRSYPVPENPRQLGSVVQLVLWTRGAEAARALYDELAPRVDDHPLYRIYHGELELWMGAYESAERIFRKALDRDKKVRWAWIGLGASVMFQGDLKQAQKLWRRGLRETHGDPGPTLFAYRGECYRRQGELKLARNELETGLRQKPQRLSARINLALLDQRPEDLARVEQDCVAIAPLLMSELEGSTSERLERVLEAMRGNRSSSEWHVSYHLWGHVWRRGVQ